MLEVDKVAAPFMGAFAAQAESLLLPRYDKPLACEKTSHTSWQLVVLLWFQDSFAGLCKCRTHIISHDEKKHLP